MVHHWCSSPANCLPWINSLYRHGAEKVNYILLPDECAGSRQEEGGDQRPAARGQFLVASRRKRHLSTAQLRGPTAPTNFTAPCATFFAAPHAERRQFSRRR